MVPKPSIVVRVYQIGVGSFGRYGFEKFIELHKHFDDVDVYLEGVCEPDFDRAEKAEKFAKANSIDLNTFKNVEEMYKHASEHEETVLVYDAGPTEKHSNNIYRSMRNGFFHLTEKPPSMTRNQHVKEKKLAENNSVMWTVDFIERESPVVKKAVELIKGKKIEEVSIYRESSVGIEKMINPVERHGVKGGDILDKMVHEVYVLDLLESAGNKPELELENAESHYLMPKSRESEKLLAMDGGYTPEINYNTATGQTEAVFTSSDTKVKLNSSWLGLSDRCRVEAKNIEDKTGVNIVEREYSEMDETAFIDEEARFFVIEGEVSLVGDMLGDRLFNLDTGEKIETDYFMHDQLYRVMEKAVLNATGKDVNTISEKETDVFMNGLFDVKEAATGGDYLEELDKALERFDSLVLRDGKVIEAEGTDFIAG